MTPLQQKVIDRIRNGSEGAVLASILEDLVRELSDVRNIKEINDVEIRGRQLACDIVEQQFIAILKIKGGNKDLVEDSFE